MTSQEQELKAAKHDPEIASQLPQIWAAKQHFSLGTCVGSSSSQALPNLHATLAQLPWLLLTAAFTNKILMMAVLEGTRCFLLFRSKRWQLSNPTTDAAQQQSIMETSPVSSSHQGRTQSQALPAGDFVEFLLANRTSTLNVTDRMDGGLQKQDGHIHVAKSQNDCWD